VEAILSQFNESRVVVFIFLPFLMFFFLCFIFYFYYFFVFYFLFFLKTAKVF